jgi:DNA-binding NarL/FixJ family response regulator
VRTVLVCVRTPVAAQAIATAASRLGVANAVRTAVTMVEALSRLAEQPADLVLADPAVCRPDSAEFARRVLVASPGATVVFLGSEDPRAAQAAIAAGARGVIRMDLVEPITTLAKVVLLILSQPAARSDAASQSGAVRAGIAHGAQPMGRNAGPLGTRPMGGPPAARTASGLPGAVSQPAAAAAALGGPAVPMQRGDGVIEPPRRRVDLTERELQVLRGMADGKSNAEIGRDLFVSEDTVKTHARRLFRKLGARDRAHAVAAAFRAGLVS